MSWDKVRQSADENVGFIRHEIKHVTANLPKRAAASEGERDACEYIAEGLKYGAQDVRTEEFKVAPEAATGWLYVTATLTLLAFVAYFFVSFVSVVLLILAAVPFAVQGVLCSTAFDGMYKEGVSHNVTAVRKCTGEVRRRVFFTAHADAAYTMRLSEKISGRFTAATAVLSVIGFVYLLAADIARWAYLGSMGAGLAADAYLVTGLVGLVFVPFWIACFFMFDKKSVADGANDDLSGCYVAVALLKAMQDADLCLEHTEVGVIITGAEESGLRGAKAWCAMHKDDYLDEETVFVTLDTLRDAKYLKAGTRDLNGLVATDAALADAFAEAAGKEGINCGKGGFSFGATDAAAFAQNGRRAVSVTALAPDMPDYYHTSKDTVDNMDDAVLADCFKAAARFVEEFDRQ